MLEHSEGQTFDCRGAEAWCGQQRCHVKSVLRLLQTLMAEQHSLFR